MADTRTDTDGRSGTAIVVGGILVTLFLLYLPLVIWTGGAFPEDGAVAPEQSALAAD